MIKRFTTTVCSLCIALCAMAQGWPSNYGGVMLQGFFWDSFVDTQWSHLQSQVDEMSDYFDLIWVPQSGNCNSSYNVMGYTPVYWFDHNSSFGSESQLRSFIQACQEKNLGVIADVVINHRNSLGVGGSWVDFPAETYQGVTYQLGLGDICKNDDGGQTAQKYAVTGANDTGEDWSGMRDLDHTSENVQKNVIAYLRFLMDDLGYKGFRYDMTKGYGAAYTALYNSTVKPEFSVGEYWDGNVTYLQNWLNGTKIDGAIQSATFDFATRYAIRDACNQNNWTKLSNKGLAAYDNYKRYAVTFVENHDTQYRSANETGDPVKNYIEAANAYILSMPGTPCIFLSHWKQYKQTIKQLVLARKLMGIHNQSAVTQVSNSSALYACEVSGTHGKLLFAAGTATPKVADNYILLMQGLRYYIYADKSVHAAWVDVPSGTYSNPFQVTMTAVTDDADARLVYTTDGSVPTASSNSVVSGSAIDVNASMVLQVGLLKGGKVTNVLKRNYTIQPFEAHQATVYLKDPQWNQVYFYAWANDGKSTQLNGSWPGKTVTATTLIGGQKWYYQSFDVNTEGYSFNIIFDQGNGKAQTVDIGPLSEDRYYEIAAMVNGKYTVKEVTDEVTGIDAVTVDNAYTNQAVNVYSLDGKLLRVCPKGTTPLDAIAPFAHGIYIINGKKMVK